MNAGVENGPCGVENAPARASPLRPSSAKRNGCEGAGLMGVEASGSDALAIERSALAVGLPLALAARQPLAAELGLELGAVARALLAIAMGQRLRLLHAWGLRRAGKVGDA